LVAEKRKVPHENNKNYKIPRWFILDIPPDDHPGWKAFKKKRIKRIKRTGETFERDFPKWAKIFLDRFNKARIETEAATFTQIQIARMLKTRPNVIAKWAEIGVKGYGRLPRLKLAPDKRNKKMAIKGNASFFYYHQKDVIRFLKGELKDPKKKFASFDDATTDNEMEEIAERHGYYVHDPNKVYPMTFDGFLRWATENVMREDKAQKKWIPFRPIGIQIECYQRVWKLAEVGKLKHRFIRLCRPRGDFKSFDAILIFLFRFFNMPREKILLAANSKDQSDYALYDEAKDIVLNSPKLMATPGLDVGEDEMKLRTGKREVFSRIKSIASKQGSLSNATCIVFSEIHKLRDQSFIVELEGSIRQVANAMSIIESTVSREGTYYHRQYKISLEGKDPLLYFQYYCDKHYNPNMTPEELKHYEHSFFPEEYDMYFRNRWGDAGTGLFSTAKIMEVGILGIDGKIGPSEELTKTIKEYIELEHKLSQLKGATDTTDIERKMVQLKKRFIPVDSLYQLPAEHGVLDKIKDYYRNIKIEDFFVGMGIDRAEQLSARSDRTFQFTVAKAYIDSERWICFIVDVFYPQENKKKVLMDRLRENEEKIGSYAEIHFEKSQCLDIHDECEEEGYPSVLQSASYEHQHEMFLELYKLMKDGLLKCPTVPLWHDENDVVYETLPPDGIQDILREELSVFEHTPKTMGKKAGWFGSPFKKTTGRTKKGETKDDSIFALGHAVAAANSGETPASSQKLAFAGAVINKDVIGDYGDIM
jgi:hypothetical protein